MDEEKDLVLPPRVVELLVELAAAFNEDEDFVKLVAGRRGGSLKGRITRVSTQSGVDTYGVPIGTVITEKMKQNAKLGKISGKVKKSTDLTPGAPAALAETVNQESSSAKTPKPTDTAGKFNADPNLKMIAIGTHPRVPGAKVYHFSDGTGIVEDPRGRRSKRSKMDGKEFKSKGWSFKDVEDDASGDSLISDEKSNFENAKSTLDKLPSSKIRYRSSHKKAVKDFLNRGPILNDLLRRDADQNIEDSNTINDIRDSLDESIVKNPVTVYRGMSFGSTQERDQFVSNSFKTGSSITDKGFVVASADRDQAQLSADGDNASNLGIIMNIAVPKGSRALAISHVVASKDEDKNDVLLADNSKFVVNNVEYDGSGRPIVDATYVDPQMPESMQKDVEENPFISPEALDKAKQRRFTWIPKDLGVAQTASKDKSKNIKPGESKSNDTGSKPAPVVGSSGVEIQAPQSTSAATKSIPNTSEESAFKSIEKILTDEKE